MQTETTFKIAVKIIELQKFINILLEA